MEILLIMLRENAAFVVYLVLAFQGMIWRRLNMIDSTHNDLENRIIVAETRLKISHPIS